MCTWVCFLECKNPQTWLLTTLGYYAIWCGSITWRQDMYDCKMISAGNERVSRTLRPVKNLRLTKKISVSVSFTLKASFNELLRLSQDFVRLQLGSNVCGRRWILLLSSMETFHIILYFVYQFVHLRNTLNNTKRELRHSRVLWGGRRVKVAERRKKK